MMLLVDKKVDFKVLDNLYEIEDKWIKVFAGDIHLNESYLWHVFSKNYRQDYLEGDEAIEAFNNLKKKGYYIFYERYRYDDEDLSEYENKVFEVFGWSKLKAEDLFDCDIYVVDKEFKWTYVSTHEGDWFGPYFCKL